MYRSFLPPGHPRNHCRPPPDPRRAAIYLRVSTGPQAEHGYGLEAQEYACRTLAAREGLTVVEVLRDVESGTAWDLPGLQRLLDLAEAGAIGAAVVYDPDRLSRSLAKYGWLDHRLTQAGVTVHYVTVGTAATEEQRLFHDIKAVFAQWDHRRIVRRLAQGKRTKVASGRNHGVGVAPYGYRYERDERGRQAQLAPDPAEAPIVQQIFRAVPRCSLGQIAAALRAGGVPTRHGRPWSTATLYSILHNPVYVGRQAYGRRSGAHRRPQSPEQWLYAPAPALITEAEWEAAHAALARRRQGRERRARRADDPFLLRGRLTCGHCGGPLACETQRQGVRAYACPRSRPVQARRRGVPLCPMRQVAARGIEALAWQAITATLLDPAALAEGLAAAQALYAAEQRQREERLAALDREIAQRRARLGRLLDEQLDAPAGSETARLLAERARQLDVQLQHLQAEREQLAQAPHGGLAPAEIAALEAFAADVRAGLAAATVAEQRRIVELLDLRATVACDGRGLRLGQRHRFHVRWTAVLPLQDVRCTAGEFVNIQTVVLNTADGTQVQVTRHPGPPGTLLKHTSPVGLRRRL